MGERGENQTKPCESSTTNWRCDICRNKWFLTYQEALQHEAICIVKSKRPKLEPDTITMSSSGAVSGTTTTTTTTGVNAPPPPPPLPPQHHHQQQEEALSVVPPPLQTQQEEALIPPPPTPKSDHKQITNKNDSEAEFELGDDVSSSSLISKNNNAAGVQYDLLKDAQSNVRGAYLTFQEDEIKILEMLSHVWKNAENKLGHVQNYTKHLLHYNIKSPGFPVSSGSDDRELFAGFDESTIEQFESLLTLRIRNVLHQIGYCSNDQNIVLYLSFLKTLLTEVQPPHIDFQWEAIEPKHFKTKPRSYKNNYNEWVPFVALFPLTKAGMRIQIWNDCKIPQLNEEPGVLVDIDYGKMLLLRADVIHAGGFQTHPNGNPRAHFYVYKSPRAVQHSYPLANCYELTIHNTTYPLINFFRHNPKIARTANVKFVNLKQPKQKPVATTSVQSNHSPQKNDRTTTQKSLKLKLKFKTPKALSSRDTDATTTDAAAASIQHSETPLETHNDDDARVGVAPHGPPQSSTTGTNVDEPSAKELPPVA